MLLQLKNVGKSYGGVAALRNVTLGVEEGQIVGLMGANGAGKTTVFGLIAGTHAPTRGEIWFNGGRIDGMAAYEINRLGVARTFQIVRPFAGLTVRENLFVAAMHGHAPATTAAIAEERIRSILDGVGLLPQAHRIAGSLTLVDRKRLEIARALATAPRLILLDEVLAGLTATEAGEALDAIRRLHSQFNLTIIIIEHVMRALMRLSERIVVLHHGEKLAEGSPEEIASDAAVASAYFGKRAL
jgi:branched-chain amino acid transport system ATP-binding protein